MTAKLFDFLSPVKKKRHEPVKGEVFALSGGWRTLPKLKHNDAEFRVCFERGEDFGRIDILIRLASDVKMEIDASRRALANGEYLEPVPHG